jgi:hypothetical protein
MSRRYLLGAGYHEGREGRQEREFYPVWLANTVRHFSPTRIVVITDSGAVLPPAEHSELVTQVPLTGDLGYHLDLLEGRKAHHFPGGPAIVLALAMLAYCDEADFVYKEQDLLCFGDCLGEMYRQIGEGGLIVGRNQAFGLANSLMLVKHEYIPVFVREYLSTLPENDESQLCELKFARLLETFPRKWKQYDFGYDRDRPFNVADKAWYAQQISPEEMTLIRDAGLL